ncbi:hypothetical protein ATEIFO6365_0016011900 [Aspergillus terreus]|uniref:Uncharacterized protein n=1 Tax=Aspergillus terreus TaxID=33178 RepID=A0A5M3ZHL3_ASPTE|nr:hypothetical protein ATETN484_0017012400 [Aspergillus terreus]GFF21795.1 hypothetical protein ATEIFO6365_0016011900 [Aspergillus terreus]
MQNMTTDCPSNRGSGRLTKILLALMISSTAIGAGVLIWGSYKLYANKKEVFGYIQSVYHRGDEGRLQPLYSPLQRADEIRLLVLQAGKYCDPIHVRLQHVSLKQGPSFEALSYVWGDPTPEKYIYCEGKQVRVRESLYEALHALRRPDTERCLWADAICINQGDAVEKGKQILIMGDIYSCAQQVLVWLGSPSQATENAFNALQEIDSYLKRASWVYRSSPFQKQLLRAVNWPYLVDLNRKNVRELQKYDWKSIMALLRHPWPRRVWTYQEFIRARKVTVVHGHASISAETFLNPLMEVLGSPFGQELLSSAQDVFEPHSYAKLGIQSGSQARIESLFDAVVNVLSYRAATDPRDHIYGLLGVTSDHDASDWELTPDYNASVEEVYTRYARWCLLRKNDIRYLSFAGLPDLTAKGACPSWVADWTRTMMVNDYHVLSMVPCAYQASHPTSSPSFLWIPSEPRVLHIKGRIVDTLADLAVTRLDLLTYCEKNVKSRGRVRQILRRLAYRQRILHTRLIVDDLLEAQQAIDRFCPSNLPPHAVADVVWMENCKHIASGATGVMQPEHFNEFYRTMIRNRDFRGLGLPDDTLYRAFSLYFHLLDKVRDGEQAWPPLPGSSADRLAQAQFPNRLPFDSRMTLSQRQRRTEQETHIEIRTLMARYWGGVMSKRFCSTTHGRLGWAPRRAQPGDLVCIFDGATVPYVLRLHENKELSKWSLVYWASQLQRLLLPPRRDLQRDVQYTLVGECYVHGLMEAEEAMDEACDTVFFAIS